MWFKAYLIGLKNKYLENKYPFIILLANHCCITTLITLNFF